MHRRSNSARVSPQAVRSRWPAARRVLLVSIVLIVAYRNYGDTFIREGATAGQVRVIGAEVVE